MHSLRTDFYFEFSLKASASVKILIFIYEALFLVICS